MRETLFRAKELIVSRHALTQGCIQSHVSQRVTCTFLHKPKATRCKNKFLTVPNVVEFLPQFENVLGNFLGILITYQNASNQLSYLFHLVLLHPSSCFFTRANSDADIDYDVSVLKLLRHPYSLLWSNVDDRLMGFSEA